jgi:class 3 adenylate cyclase
VICSKCRSHNDTAARYCNQCGALLAPSADSGPAPHGERRPLTALFCDIVQSTALAASLDPEEYQDVLKVFADCVRAEVARHDGHVQEFRGDGALVFFGYPQARGNEPERAVHAALAIQAAMARAPFPRALRVRVRIGIATGPMTIDARSAGAVIVGEALSLAERIQNLAQPGTVVVASSTHRFVGSRFDFADLGEHDLKGFSAPVHVWQVGASRAQIETGPAPRTAAAGGA